MPDIYAFPQLVKVVSALPTTSDYITKTFFSEGETGLTTEIEIQTMRGKNRIAPYVSELQQGKIVARDNFTAEQYSPVPVKPARNITYLDLQNRQAGETLWNPDSFETRQRKLIAKDMVELNDTIIRRKVEMASQLMFTGKVVQIGEGVSQSIDYKFTNKVTLSGMDLWTSAGSDPLSFLATLRYNIMDRGGRTPRILLGDYNAMVALVRHKTILDLADNRGVNVGNIDTRLLPNGVTHHGYLQDVGLDLYSYTGNYIDDQGVEQSFIPAGTVVMLPDGMPFEFLYGANVIAVEKQIKLVSMPVIAQVFMDEKTAVRTLELQSRPFPVPENIENWYVAKVI